MALTDTDRRRFFMASALTLLALPALWWANTSENSTAPNVAVAGIDPGIETAGAPDSPTDGDREAIAEAVELDADDEIAPVYLDGPSGAPGAGQSVVAIPAKPLVDSITARATFRSTVPNPSACIVPGLPSGTRITLVNLDNNRSVTCTTILAPGNAVGQVVLHTSTFAKIADLTSAPISVEIHR